MRLEEPGGAPHAPVASTRAGLRVRELDLLRFVAAAMVMMHHFTGVPTGAWGRDERTLFPGLAPISYFGQYGVELFFMISGFVILMTVWGRSVGDFAVSRISRLFPAYWFAVTAALVIYLVFGVQSGTTGDLGVVRSYLPNMTMLQEGFGVPHIEILYWSLWLELHFYALMLILVRFGVTYARCLAFMGGWLLLSVFALEGDFRPLNTVLISGWAPYFVAGMAFYLLYRFGSNLVLWLTVAVCWALGTHFSVVRIKPPLDWSTVDQYATPAVITGMFAVMALVATHRLSWLRWRGLTVLGALTYPLYLLHETISRPLIRWLFPDLDRWTVLGIAIGAVLAASYLVNKLIERPGQRILRRRLKTALTQIRANGGRPASRPIGGTPAAAPPGMDRRAIDRAEPETVTESHRPVAGEI